MSPTDHKAFETPGAANAIDTGHCPLCGQPNQCAIVSGLAPESCWCMTTPVSREALARIAPEQRGKACICAHCAQERKG